MNARKRFALSALAAVAVSSFAWAHGTMKTTGPAVSESQLQSLSSEGPTWHAGDGSVYDPNRTMTAPARASTSSSIALQRNQSTNQMTPAQESRITGHVDSSAGPPLTGSQEQPGNMGPNSTKGK